MRINEEQDITVFEKKVRKHQGGYPISCESCRERFKYGQEKIIWKMRINSDRYHNGTFWSCLCHDCYVSVLRGFSDSINEELSGVQDNVIR